MFLYPILDVLITGIFSMHMYRNESVSPKDVSSKQFSWPK